MSKEQYMEFCLFPKETPIIKGMVKFGEISSFDGIGGKCLTTKCFPIRGHVHDMHNMTFPVSRKGFSSNTWVSVLHHLKDPIGMGFWMYLSSNSNVYFNLGKTISFDNHVDAMTFFCPQGCNFSTTYVGHKKFHTEKQFVARAYVLGYDSIQFTRFIEYGFLKYEIVFTKLNNIVSMSQNCKYFINSFRNIKSCQWRPRMSCNTSTIFRNYL